MRSLGRLYRWNEWAYSKLPLIFASLYFACSTQGPASFAFRTIIAISLFTVCLAAFGYAINDYSDRESDRIAGKANALSHCSETAAIGAVLGPLLGSVVILVLVYRDRADILSLGLVTLFVTAGYSLHPLRFKERGICGLAASAATQRALPAVISFQAMHAWIVPSMALSVLSALIGIRYIAVHQLRDREHDLKSQVATLATQSWGPRVVSATVHVCLALEVACLVLIAVAAAVTSTSMGLAVIIGAYGLRSVARYGIFPTPESRDPRSNKALAPLYNGYLPAGLLVELIASDMTLWPVALLHGALFFDVVRKDVRSIFS